jgi:hypothetical protein
MIVINDLTYQIGSKALYTHASHRQVDLAQDNYWQPNS